MKKSILSLAVAVLLATIACTSVAEEVLHVPATPQAVASTKLIARAARALRDFVVACSTGDDETIARIVTSDAVVEYMLEEPGTYLRVEATALKGNCSSNGEQGEEVGVSNLWIFPTNDSNTVFVQYTTSSNVLSPSHSPDAKHLALLEMRRDRIFKMHNFSPALAPSDTRGIRGHACEACFARQRTRPEDLADVHRSFRPQSR
jgi:hypothetical protein